MTGRMMSEKLGKWSFWVMFIGFNVGFFPMHIVGLLGMPRRIYTYGPALGLQSMNELMTVGAFVLGIGILISMINLMISLRSGKLAGKNPWNSDGLEWETDSPPKSYATVHIPTVQPGIRYGTTTMRRRIPMTTVCSTRRGLRLPQVGWTPDHSRWRRCPATLCCP